MLEDLFLLHRTKMTVMGRHPFRMTKIFRIARLETRPLLESHYGSVSLTAFAECIRARNAGS